MTEIICSVKGFPVPNGVCGKIKVGDDDRCGAEVDTCEHQVALPKITFSDFNSIRYARGSDAARFDLVDEEGESYWLWMSESDIQKNIELFPHCRDELKKGLKYYRPFGEIA